VFTGDYSPTVFVGRCLLRVIGATNRPLMQVQYNDTGRIGAESAAADVRHWQDRWKGSGKTLKESFTATSQLVAFSGRKIDEETASAGSSVLIAGCIRNGERHSYRWSRPSAHRAQARRRPGVAQPWMISEALHSGTDLVAALSRCSRSCPRSARGRVHQVWPHRQGAEPSVPRSQRRHSRPGERVPLVARDHALVGDPPDLRAREVGTRRRDRDRDRVDSAELSCPAGVTAAIHSAALARMRLHFASGLRRFGRRGGRAGGRARGPPACRTAAAYSSPSSSRSQPSL